MWLPRYHTKQSCSNEVMNSRIIFPEHYYPLSTFYVSQLYASHFRPPTTETSFVVLCVLPDFHLFIIRCFICTRTNYRSLCFETRTPKHEHRKPPLNIIFSINTQVIRQNRALSLARYLGLSADNHLDGQNGCQ